MRKYALKKACQKYNPDDDVEKEGGAYGHRLADELMRLGKFNSFARENFEDCGKTRKEGDLVKIARTALTRFSELQLGESISDKELSERLNSIRKAGYNVPPYSKLNKKGKWNLLMEIRRDVRIELKEKYPDIAEDIQRQNQKQKDDAYDIR